MAISRDKPYIWVTWLTKLLVGENSCEWAAWFRAHYTNFRRAPDDFDSAGWQMNHTALLNEVRDRLQAEGRTVFIEKQNRFVLRGTSATLGGKPDLIAPLRGQGRDIRRQDRAAFGLRPRAGDDLHVRRASGPGPVQEYDLRRRSGVPRLRGVNPRLRLSISGLSIGWRR